ncbi:MAG: discoidin domain-containing protein, partial [Gemmataceae bacterium]|nr:discoidin domain-containing protein [Gemmataceae bacterium]
GLVHRLLAADPADRPGTAAEVEEALAAFAGPTKAPDPVPDSAPGWRDPFPSAAYAPVRSAPRRPRSAGEKARIWVLLLLGLVLNVAAVGLAVAWWTGALDRKPEAPPEPAPKAPPAVAPKKPDRGAYRYVRYLAPADSWGNIAEFQVYGPPAAGGRPLAGEVIGTDGSWNDEGNTRDKAFDGDLGTFFDAPEPIAEGAWVGLDLGAAHVIAQVKYAPRDGRADRMVGGRFQASNTPDFSAGVVDLYTVTVAPPEGVLTARAVGPGPARGQRAKPDPDPDEVRD